MDVARPYAAVCPSLDGEVLQTLAVTNRVLTGREVALLTGRSSHSGVLRVLNRLTEHGLVNRIELNRASLYSLNREHLAAEAVIELMGLRSKLIDQIQAEIGGWQLPPRHASLFGSTARADGDTDSDIDLFVVRPASTADDACWRDQLDGLVEKIEQWTGNRAAIVEASEDELARIRTSEASTIARLRSDAIVLSGSSVSELLGDERA
jgi:predicted nucleotidyltransferase